MNKQTEALKMAIAELEKGEGWMDNVSTTIQACKEALEQPAQEYLTRAQQVIRANNSAQEPVAVVYSMQDGYVGQMVVKDIPHKTKLYTHPAPSWQGISEAEAGAIFRTSMTPHEFACAIEQALKEKNER